MNREVNMYDISKMKSEHLFEALIKEMKAEQYIELFRMMDKHINAKKSTFHIPASMLYKKEGNND